MKEYSPSDLLDVRGRQKASLGSCPREELRRIEPGFHQHSYLAGKECLEVEVSEATAVPHEPLLFTRLTESLQIRKGLSTQLINDDLDWELVFHTHEVICRGRAC